jgi:vancomycin resistance protein YoaR
MKQDLPIARHADRGRRGSIYLGLAGGLLAVSGALAGGYYVVGPTGGGGVPVAPRAAAERVETAAADSAADLSTLATRLLDETVAVEIGSQRLTLRWADLGVVVDDQELPQAARRAASDEPIASLRAAGALPLTLDRARASEALTVLKARHDRAPLDARLDLEARTIVDEAPGFGIDVYASLPRLEAAARAGAATVRLAATELPARVTRAALGIEDISTVLGHWETKFAVSDKDRNFNLKLAASKINGHVIPPGGTFSFNDVVGDRTEKQGYKIAHVIQAGEMIDGLAGGTCQISSTLFGAAFFAGLDIEKTRPHSRPSTYQPFGFDSTVVYPVTDLALSNPFDFPVAIHYVVAGGVARVEVLGKPRPYDKVVFEREVKEAVPFTTEERPDETMPEGAQILDQPGYDGYKVVRYRKLYKDGKLVRTDKWNLEYKPVTQYVRKGTSTDPAAKPPEEPKHHMPKPPGDGDGRMEQ